jgi:uncharacterized membrane protein YiaA
MSFGLYIAGYVLFILGVGYGAHLLNTPPKWIAVIVLCLVGLALMHAVKATRHRDPS